MYSRRTSLNQIVVSPTFSREGKRGGEGIHPRRRHLRFAVVLSSD